MVVKHTRVSEHVLQGKLNNAGRNSGARNDTERAGRASVRTRVIELGMIQSVEKLASELQASVLA
jgi:hypothetical protein